MKKIILLISITLLVFIAAACSKQNKLISREPVQNAAPLGVEVGYANLAGVKAKLGAVTSLKKAGNNQYSNGQMLFSNGEGLGVNGLSGVLLIFDKNDTLVGVVMTLRRAPKAMLRTLINKYKLVDNQIDDFMDFGYAKLEQGASWIEIDAPHLSFTMEVRYLTKQLMTNFKKQLSEAEMREKKEQSSKF